MRVGHTTFFNSAYDSLKKSLKKVINFIIFLKKQTYPINNTGQEGLEPSTFGFGDRHSTIGVIGL